MLYGILESNKVQNTSLKKTLTGFQEIFLLFML